MISRRIVKARSHHEPPATRAIQREAVHRTGDHSAVCGGVRLRDSNGVWVSVNERRTHRIYVTRLGPFSLVLLALGIGLVAALVFVLAIGSFLIWISVVALLVTATILSALLRQSFRRWY
jgi:hypothetical protein